MKYLVQILIILALLLAAGQVWAQGAADFISPETELSQADNNWLDVARQLNGLPEEGALNRLRELFPSNRQGERERFMEFVAWTNEVNIPPYFRTDAFQNALSRHSAQGFGGITPDQIERSGTRDTGSTDCGRFDVVCGMLKVVVFMLEAGKGLIQWLLAGADALLDLSIDLSVRDFRGYVGDGLREAWKLLRDLVNLTFIFILLYVAIGTILRLDSVNTKKVLTRVIIAALLINFSFLFTSVMIDASNVVANGLYTAARRVPNQEGELSIRKAILSGQLDPSGKAVSEGASIQLENAIGGDTKNAVDRLKRQIAGLLGQILLLVIATTVFLAGAVLFVIRSVVLIFVLATSSVAFLAFAVGGEQLDKIGKRWKNALANQLIFAPAFMLFIFMSIRITQILNNNLLQNNSNDNFFSLLLAYLIANGLMLGSLMVAKELGVQGAGVANSALGGLKKLGLAAAGGATFGAAGALGRNTVGRLGRNVADSEWLKKKEKESNFAGRFLSRTALRTSSGVAGASFDTRASGIGKATGLNQLGKAGGKGGYDETLKKDTEKQKKIAELLAPNKEKQKEEESNKKTRIESAQALVDAGNKTEQERATRSEAVKKEIEETELDIQTVPDGPGKQKAIERLRALESEQRFLNTQAEKFAQAKAALEEIRAEKSTSRKRQEAYAERREAGGFLSTIITGNTKRTRKAQADAIRDNAKKTKKDRDAENIAKKLEKLMKDSDKKDEPKEGDKK